MARAQKRRETRYIVVHCAATPPSWDGGLAEITAMHKRRGWSRCGYRHVIRRNGVRESAPGGDGIVSNHVRGFNSVALGVCLVGGVDAKGRPDANYTREQMLALADLLEELAYKYPGAVICGHRDLSPDRDGDGVIEPHEHLKACPCFDVIPWAASRGLPAAPIRGSWRGSATPPLVDSGAAPDVNEVELQRLLRAAGFDVGPVDGIIGPRTRKALRGFQKRAGLPDTGRFDEETVARLRNMDAAAQRPQPLQLIDNAPDGLDKPMAQSTTVAAAAGQWVAGNIGAGSLFALSGMDWRLGLGILALVALVSGFCAWWIFRERKRYADESRFVGQFVRGMLEASPSRRHHAHPERFSGPEGAES